MAPTTPEKVKDLVVAFVRLSVELGTTVGADRVPDCHCAYSVVSVVAVKLASLANTVPEPLLASVQPWKVWLALVKERAVRAVGVPTGTTWVVELPLPPLASKVRVAWVRCQSAYRVTSLVGV